MPHKCVKCAKYFADGSPQLMKGCPCGGRVFLFIRPEQMSLRDLYDAGIEIVVQNDRIQELAREQPVSIELELEEAAAPAKADHAPPWVAEPGKATEPAKAAVKPGVYPAAVAKPFQVPKRPGARPEGFVVAGVKTAKPWPREADAAENVTILEKGVYELDLEGLMKGDPLVVRSHHGVYYVKISAVKRKKG